LKYVGTFADKLKGTHVLRNVHYMFEKSGKRDRKYIPTGIKVKSAILFSIFLTVLSCPLTKKVPELVRLLNGKEQVKLWFIVE